MTISTRGMAFPKPGERKRESRPAVITYPDGRQVCDQTTKAGKELYRKLTYLCWRRNNRRCVDCGLAIARDSHTLEHEAGRGMAGGHRDDRIYVRDASGRLKRQNGAAHPWCNQERGSRRTELLQFPKRGKNL